MEKKVIKSLWDLELPSAAKTSDDTAEKLKDPKPKDLIVTEGAKPTASISAQSAHPSPKPPNQIQSPVIQRIVGAEGKNEYIAKETKRLEELARTLEQRDSKLALDQAKFARERDTLNTEKLTLQNRANQVIANQRDSSEKEKANYRRAAELDLREAKILTAEPTVLVRLAEMKQKELELETLMAEVLRPEAELKELQTALAKAQKEFERKCDEVSKLLKTKEANKLLQKRVSVLESDLEESRFALSAEEERHAESQREVKELSGDLTAANSKLKALQTKFRDQNILLADVQNERDRLSRAEVDNRSLRVSIKKVEAESIALKKKVDDLLKANAVRARAAPSAPAKVTESASPFAINSMAVLGWLSSAVLDAFQPPEDVVSIGSGPFPEDEFDDYLKTLDITPYTSGCNWVIVGRTGWTPQQLEELIEEAAPGELRIFSQELFIAGQLSTHDPFSADPELLMEFAKGHPALEYLMGSGFEWPILQEQEELGVPQYGRGSSFGVDESPIHQMGYVVGIRNGLSVSKRQKLLRKAFEGAIPQVGHADYMAEWGMPNTRNRLWRIAHHINNQISRHLSTSNKIHAVNDWVNDMDWLESTFYKSWMNFSWPNIK